jgi:integrase
VDNQCNRYLSADEETRLMAQLKGRRRNLYPLVALALGTGMRRGELLNLSWRHVDFLRGVIHVVNTKTARDRIIPMSQSVREVLTEQRQTQEGDLVFASRRIAKRRMDEGLVDVKKGFVAACIDAGIADFHFHDLRHTFATRLGDSGCNITTIARCWAIQTFRCLCATRMRLMTPSEMQLNTLKTAASQKCHKH